MESPAYVRQTRKGLQNFQRVVHEQILKSEYQILELNEPTLQTRKEAIEEKSMPSPDRAMGKWKLSVDMMYLFTRIRPLLTAIQAMHATIASTCTHGPFRIS